MLANRVRMANALPTTIIGTWSLNEYLNVSDIIELKTTSSQFFFDWAIVGNYNYSNGTELKITLHNAIQIISGRIYSLTDNGGRFLHAQNRNWEIRSETTNSAHNEALLKFLIRNAKYTK